MSDKKLLFRIGGITDMSTVDWYGRLSMVVFWAGCNLRCPYCHNSSLIPLDSGEMLDLNFLRERIEKALTPVETIEAVVFTGGEPLLQPDGVIHAAKLFKEYGLKIMLDTNGSIFQSFQRIVKTNLVDRVALDIKAPLSTEEYCKFGVLGEEASGIISSIKAVLKLCTEKSIPLELRTTVAPGISDTSTFIKNIANSVTRYPAVYYLQQFDSQGDIYDHRLKEIKPPTREKMFELAEAAKEAGLKNVYIKTRLFGLEKIE